MTKSQGSKALLAALVGALSLAPAASDAQVTANKPDWYTPDRRGAMASTVAPFKLPDEPAVPTGCVKPTKAQCVDGAFWSSNACASAPAADPKGKAMRAYCTWQLQKAWTTAAGGVQPTSFPTTNPVSPTTALGSGRRVDYGKQAGFTVQPSGATSRGYSRVTSANKPATATPPPRGGTYTPRAAQRQTPTAGLVASGAGGTYASQQMASVIAAQSSVDEAIGSAGDWSAAGAAATLQKAAKLGEWVMARPTFVTPGPGVQSCNEYAYKRWGNWSTFQYAAKRTGRWYRTVYKIAMDPDSPVFVNQDLKQTGTSAPIPVPWRDVLPGERLYGTPPSTLTYPVTPGDVGYNDPYIPPNAFYSVKPDWLGPANHSNHAKLGVSAADADLLRQAYASRANHKIKARAGFVASDPLAMHREAKTRLDTVYGNPLDEDLADIQKRTRTYLGLASRRVALLEREACMVAGDPCFICRPRPPIPPGIQKKAQEGLQRPAGIGKILEQVGGWDVINPNPLEVASLFEVGTPQLDARTLTAFNRAAGGLSELAAGVGRPSLGGEVGGVVRSGAAPSGGPVPAPPATSAYAACMQELLQQKPAVSSAIDDVERDLTRLALAEAKNPKGCLANPGPNTTNMCDWNYEYFASIVTDAFSAQLERDVSACNASISGAQTALPPPNQNAGFAVTKSATRQELVYPCVQRRDFSTSAPEITEFIAKSGSYLGEQCEVERQNRAIKDLQAGYADLFKGLEWDGGSGRVRSGESDALTLGDSTLGASFDYATAWELQRTNTQSRSTDTLRGCSFEGAASQVAKATIRFFGSDQEILYSNGAVKARSVPGHVRHQARWKDLDSGRYRWLTPPTANDGLVDRNFAGPDEVLSRWTPPLYLADLEQSYWIVIGEFPVKITLGFGASAGLLFKFAGRSGDNCADATLKSPTNFRLLVEATPYAQANAFADASLNYPGVAAAGVRLDLELLRLGLPMGVDIAHPREDWSFRAGGRVTIDMLSGSLSAYVSVGAWPLEVTLWAKLMDWDGYHESFPLWGIERSVPGPAVRTLLAKYVDLGNVSCTNDSVRNASCSTFTYQTHPAQAPCPSGGCTGAGGAPEYRTIDSIVTQPKDWYLCRFSEYDRNRLTTYKNACTGFTR